MNGRLVGLVMLGSWLIGCGAEDPDPVAETSGDPTTMSSNSMTSIAESSESTLGETSLGETSLGETSLGETTIGETSETTSGLPATCGEATTESECNAVANEYEECAWLTSRTVANGDQCMEVEDVGGACVVATQDDSCGPPSTPTCPDGVTMVYYREVGLEIGAIQLISFESETLCEGPGDGFELCSYVEGDPATYDPPECACDCPA